jgi:hypothetical protein
MPTSTKDENHSKPFNEEAGGFSVFGRKETANLKHIINIFKK